MKTKNEMMAKISPKRGSLSSVIRGIKSAVTKYAHENNIPFAWQTRFYDRIIRDPNEMNRIADYLENNVARWDTEKQNNPNITILQ